MERWRGIAAVTPSDRRLLVVTDDSLRVEDPTGAHPPIEFDLIALAERGVLLPYATTMTLADRDHPERERLQLRAVDPPTFDTVDWPPRVRELVDAQLAASAAARTALRRQLTRVVAGTIAGLALVLVLLVVVLLLT